MGSDKQSKKNGIGKGTPGPGRPKGSPNKFTRSVRDAFQFAFDELGGGEGLVVWAKADEKNLTEFYKLCARLIPIEMTGKDGKELPAAPDLLELARSMIFTLEQAARAQPTQH